MSSAIPRPRLDPNNGRLLAFTRPAPSAIVNGRKRRAG
jgi:hypothetical protein